MKSKKGITLITLVITIVILLILAGITITSMTGENGLFTRTQQATTQSKQAELEEQVKLAVMASLDNHGNLDESQLQENLGKIKGATVTGTTYPYTVAVGSETTKVFEDGTVGETASGGGSNSGSGSGSGIGNSSTIASGTYTPGQEVEFKGEKFFVVEDKGSSVVLLAKYCLNRAGTAQVDKNARYSDYTSGSDKIEGYGRRFSANNYWSNDFTSSPFDLQTDAMITKATADGTTVDENNNTIKNAVLTAKSYGESKGVTGRLMTKAEADSMVSSNSVIMYGKWADGTKPTEGYLYWWLGAANDTGYVWYVDGDNSRLRSYGCINAVYGVRPVLVVSES